MAQGAEDRCGGMNSQQPVCPPTHGCPHHKHNNYKVLNEVDMLKVADNMPGKWQLLIFLGQQTILNLQNGEAAICS